MSIPKLYHYRDSVGLGQSPRVFLLPWSSFLNLTDDKNPLEFCLTHRHFQTSPGDWVRTPGVGPRNPYVKQCTQTILTIRQAWKTLLGLVCAELAPQVMGIVACRICPALPSAPPRQDQHSRHGSITERGEVTEAKTLGVSLPQHDYNWINFWRPDLIRHYVLIILSKKWSELVYPSIHPSIYFK